MTKNPVSIRAAYCKGQSSILKKSSPLISIRADYRPGHLLGTKAQRTPSGVAQKISCHGKVFVVRETNGISTIHLKADISMSAISLSYFPVIIFSRAKLLTTEALANLGKSAIASTNGLTNATSLGNGAVVNASNKIRFGNTAVSVIEGQVAYTTSDGRFKSNVKSDAPGLDFVMGLKPVPYNFDYTDFSRFLGEKSVDYAVLAEKEQKREMGFVAQEVENLCRKQGWDLSNIVHAPESAADNYAVAYGQLVVPLVKAMQEQQAQIEELKNMVAQLLSDRDKSADMPDLQTWPNPTGDLLNISLPGTEGATLSLFSSEGKLLRSFPAQAGTQQLDLKGLPAGSYFLQADLPGKPPLTKVVVKSN